MLLAGRIGLVGPKRHDQPDARERGGDAKQGTVGQPSRRRRQPVRQRATESGLAPVLHLGNGGQQQGLVDAQLRAIERMDLEAPVDGAGDDSEQTVEFGDPVFADAGMTATLAPVAGGAIGRACTQSRTDSTRNNSAVRSPRRDVPGG